MKRMLIICALVFFVFTGTAHAKLYCCRNTVSQTAGGEGESGATCYGTGGLFNERFEGDEYDQSNWSETTDGTASINGNHSGPAGFAQGSYCALIDSDGLNACRLENDTDFTDNQTSLYQSYRLHIDDTSSAGAGDLTLIQGVYGTRASIGTVLGYDGSNHYLYLRWYEIDSFGYVDSGVTKIVSLDTTYQIDWYQDSSEDFQFRVDGVRIDDYATSGGGLDVDVDIDGLKFGMVSWVNGAMGVKMYLDCVSASTDDWVADAQCSGAIGSAGYDNESFESGDTAFCTTGGSVDDNDNVINTYSGTTWSYCSGHALSLFNNSGSASDNRVEFDLTGEASGLDVYFRFYTKSAEQFPDNYTGCVIASFWGPGGGIMTSIRARRAGTADRRFEIVQDTSQYFSYTPGNIYRIEGFWDFSGAATLTVRCYELNTAGFTWTQLETNAGGGDKELEIDISGEAALRIFSFEDGYTGATAKNIVWLYDDLEFSTTGWLGEVDCFTN